MKTRFFCVKGDIKLVFYLFFDDIRIFAAIKLDAFGDAFVYTLMVNS